MLVGGYSHGGTVSDNKVFITNTDENKTYNFKIVSGGSTISGEATNNKVTINGNVTPSGFIAGGVAEAGDSEVCGNQVIIQSGTVTGKIYGGYGYLNSNALIDKNNITITDPANVAGADLYGGYADNTQATISNNTLTLDGWSGSVNSVQNFSAIDFEKVKWQNGGTVLNIKNASQDVLNGTEININSLNFEGGTEINKGDNMTFVASENKINLGITEANLNVDSGFLAGVTVKGDGNFTVDDKGNVTYTVQEVKTNKQIDLVAENRAVAAAFVNQGTDLISDSLDTLSRDDAYGVKTFAAVRTATLKLTAGVRLSALAMLLNLLTAMSSAGACSTKTAAVTTAPLTSLITNFSAATAALFITAAALRQGTRMQAAFIRKVRCVPVC